MKKLPAKEMEQKLERLEEISIKLEEVKELYSEYDNLVKDLLPSFVEEEGETIRIKKEIKVKSKTYRLDSKFFDARKGIISKVWKSSCIDIFKIETKN